MENSVLEREIWSLIGYRVRQSPGGWCVSWSGEWREKREWVAGLLYHSLPVVSSRMGIEAHICLSETSIKQTAISRSLMWRNDETEKSIKNHLQSHFFCNFVSTQSLKRVLELIYLNGLKRTFGNKSLMHYWNTQTLLVSWQNASLERCSLIFTSQMWI